MKQSTPFILFSLTCLFFAPVLLTTTDLAGRDFQEIHYPLLKFLVDQVRNEGIIPLWNPHQFLGYSVIGNPQNGLFYPPNWLLILFGGDQIYEGVAVLIALHMFWMSWGAAYFAKLWGAAPLPAILGGVLVGFGGFTAARIYAGHYAVLLTLAWMPWILAGYRLAVQKGTSQWAIPGAIGLAWAIMAGHPQFVYITGLGLISLWIYELLAKNNFVMITRQFALLVIVGLILSAIAWLPVLDYQSKTVRGVASDSSAFANQHAIPAKQLSTLIVPNLFGEPLDEPAGYWGEPFYEEMTAYVGLLPLLLLPLLIHRREGRWFIGLAVLGIILSLGMNGGLYWIQYQLFPPARGFRAPGRNLALTSIALATGLAVTLTQLHQNPEARKTIPVLLRRMALPALIALWGSVVLLTLIGDAPQDNPEQINYILQQLLQSGILLLILATVLRLWANERLGQWGLAILVVIAVIDVGRVAWPLKNTDEVALSTVWQHTHDYIPQDNLYGRVMQMSAPPGILNGASATGYYSPQGYDPIAPDGWFRLMQKTGQFILDPGSAVNRVFGVRYVISGQPLENYGFGSVRFFDLLGTDGIHYYYENPLALPRVYLVEHYSVESNIETARSRITNGEVDRGDTVLLAEDPQCPVSERGGIAKIVNYQPNYVKIEVQADGAGILVLTDQYDDDWVVEIDGKAASLLQANTTTRAVCVPNGNHTIEFRYRPYSLRLGAIISIIGWVLILVTCRKSIATTLRLC